VNTGGGDATHLAEAARTATRALDLDPASGPALRVLALTAALRGDVPAADGLFTRALEANATDPETLLSASLFYSLAGYGQRAVDLGRRATELDPLLAFHWTGLALAYACVGQDQEAAAAAAKAFEIDPRDLPTRVIGPLLIYGRGDLGPVLQLLERAAGPEDAALSRYKSLVHVTRHALAHDRARVEALITPVVEKFFQTGVHNALYGAEVFALVGDRARSLALIRRAVALGFGCHPFLAQYSRCLEPLRGEPEFQALLGEVEPIWRARQAPVSSRPEPI
jgi:tetratricopeptide (TPR) repeat protein